MLISYTLYNNNRNINDDRLNRCSKLFSAHYGVWSNEGVISGVIPGNNVKLSSTKLKEQFLFDKNTFIVAAFDLDSNELVGHAVCVLLRCDWRIATRLCRHTWDPGDNSSSSYACGIVSSNPYAAKALQSAYNCDANIQLILSHGADIVKSSEIPYLRNATNYFSLGRCVVNTNFFVSHSELNEIIKLSGEEFLLFARRIISAVIYH